MKIAMFSDCYLDLTGGIRTVMDAEKKALEKRGHQVYIFTTSYPKSETELAKLRKENVFVVPCCRVLLRGVAPLSRRPRVIEKWLTREHPELEDFDVFYIHYEAGCSIAGVRMGQRLGIPVVQIMHGREDVGEAHIIPMGLRTFVAWFLNYLHSWYLPHEIKVRRDHYLADTIAKAKMWTLMVNHANKADYVITPAGHFREKLAHYGVRKKITVIKNAVADESFPVRAEAKSPHPDNSDDMLRLIWHSRVSGEKRIMTLLNALVKLKEKSNVKPCKYVLDVYGSGEDLIKAKQYAKLYHLPVIFHGTTSFAKLRQSLAQADLDILVSVNFDVCPMTLLEAQAMGVPVLVCDRDMADLMPRGSYLLTNGPSAEEIAESLSEVFTQPERLEKMSAVMMKHKKDALISTRIGELEKFFQEIARNK